LSFTAQAKVTKRQRYGLPCRTERRTTFHRCCFNEIEFKGLGDRVQAGSHLKRILKLDRLRLRGLSGASDEFTLAAIAQNLRRLAMRDEPAPPRHSQAAPA